MLFRSTKGNMSLGQQSEDFSRKWLNEGKVEGAVEGSVYDNVNRASLIIEAMRAASADISVSGQGHDIAAPLSSVVNIDRRSLMKAVSALSDDIYAIQLQVKFQTVFASLNYPRSVYYRRFMTYNSYFQTHHFSYLLIIQLVEKADDDALRSQDRNRSRSNSSLTSNGHGHEGKSAFHTEAEKELLLEIGRASCRERV